MTDYRALCAELVNELEEWIVCDDEAEIVDVHALIDRARAALAEQPVGPTDEELWEAWGCFEHEPFSKGDTIMQLREFLARWGQP
jgi:hypothetical protein